MFIKVKKLLLRFVTFKIITKIKVGVVYWPSAVVISLASFIEKLILVDPCTEGSPTREQRFIQYTVLHC